MSPTKHAWNLKNLEGTLSVEGISLSEEIRKKLDDISEGKTSGKKIIEELILQYKCAGI